MHDPTSVADTPHRIYDLAAVAVVVTSTAQSKIHRLFSQPILLTLNRGYPTSLAVFATLYLHVVTVFEAQIRCTDVVITRCWPLATPKQG